VVKRKAGGGEAELDGELDLPPGIQAPDEDAGTKGEGGEEEDFEVYTYLVTYTNGFARRVFDRVPIQEVVQRWCTAIGRKVAVMTFPSDGIALVTEVEGEEVVLPPAACRADLILDIVEVEEEDDGEDDEGEGAEVKVLEGAGDLPPGV
jgi:hypothetical protein